MEPIFLKAVLQEKIWGGDKLQTEFGFDIPSPHTGEAWVISAHPNGVSVIESPEEFKGMAFDQFYKEQPEFFGDLKDETFPLLIKILDAKENLSVQVHPDNVYGLKHEGELGKTECWYIIDAEPGAQIVYGHEAQSKEEFLHLVEAGKWDDLLRYIPVQKGEFYYVPHGTIHAIGGGVTILETQQSSDTTYRVYDYSRTDDQGNERELHIKQSTDVSLIPHTDPQLNIELTEQAGGSITHFLTNDYFKVFKWQVNDELLVPVFGSVFLATVIEGSGQLSVDGKLYPIEVGMSFVTPADAKEIQLLGSDLFLIASNPVVNEERE
ncbi:mannose-6-phosphate isomerase, class I [Aerococcaceae bacterium WGS1372]